MYLGIYTEEEINSDQPIEDNDELTAEKLEQELRKYTFSQNSVTKKDK